jgi:DNA primase
VRLRKAGPRYVGLCPFHTEKTPSFSVHAVHQFYKCFGCGAGGDVLKFVMEVEGLTFYETLKLLAERNGIPMPKRAEYSDPETKLRAAVYRAHEIACQLYRKALAGGAGAEARAYLARRGVTQAVADEFELGYADTTGPLTRLLEKEGYTAEQLEASGLVITRTDGSGFFDRFRGRLMFPIHNESGKPIAFGGRALASGQEPKYLNSSETPIYRKSRVLYNLHRAKEGIRKGDRTVLVEGYMDVIGVWAAGVREVVASCGTALVADQVRSLRRHSEKIVVNFDPDQAGMKAAERSIQMLLEENMRVRVLQLEGGLDPDEFVQQKGAETYQTLVEKAPGYFTWLADRARSRFDTRTVEGRVAGLQFLLPAIQKVSDKLERAAIADEVAGYLGIERGLVLDSFRKAATERREKSLAPAQDAVKPVEKFLLSALLVSEEARRRVLPALKEFSIEQFSTRRIFEALAALEAAGPFRFSDLEARLEEPDRELLTRIVFADKESEDGEFTLEQALESLRRIQEDDRASKKVRLKARINDAIRAGMLEEALRITEELGKLDRG